MSIKRILLCLLFSICLHAEGLAKGLEEGKLDSAESYYAIALRQSKLGQWGMAAENITKALKIAESLNNQTQIGKYYFFLSDIFFKLREGKKSLFYSNKAYENLKNSKGRNLLSNRLNVYMLEVLSGDLDLALRHLLEAQKNVDIQLEPFLAAKIYLYLSHVYYRKNQFHKSIIELNKIPPLYDVILNANPDIQVHAEMAMVQSHLELGNYDLARYYFERNIQHAVKVMDASDIMDCYQLGSRIYDKLGQTGKAFTYLKKYTEFNDSVSNSAMKKAIHEAEIKYQTALKEKAISDQKLQLINKDYELHKKNRYIIFGGIAFVLVILLSFAGYLVYRNKNQATELSLLKAQIHPHFLFNTLNNLYALSLVKSDEAPNVVLGLSNILRYILYECNTLNGDLNKEMDMILEYISLEKIRYEKKLEVNVHIDSDLKAYTIAPLLLLPLVENAYKHGVNKLEDESWINIETKIKGDRFLFKISNNKPVGQGEIQTKSIYGNIGLKNIKKRLDILYPNKHKFKITNSEDVFVVSLELKIKDFQTPVIS